ncbi:hypothetical protein FRB99_005725 [Tulasnella sp. 403]|nr:hypothetical protein FRB99_005725 [Tulasnella sp. 403]
MDYGVQYGPLDSSLSLKRKRDILDEELNDDPDQLPLPEGDDLEYPDEPARFGSQVLPVADLPEGFSGEPQDGAQYLFLVRRNAATLPIVTKVDNPFPNPEPQLLPPPNKRPRITTEVPSNEWRKIFEGRFDALRSSAVNTRSSKTIDVPWYKDRDSWWKFINGNLKPGALPFQAISTAQSIPSEEPLQASVSDVEQTADVIEPDPESPAEDDEEPEDSDEVVIHMTAILDEEVAVSEDVIPRTSPPPVVLAPLITPPTPNIAFERAPGYTPRPPTTDIISQLDNKTIYQVLMYFSYWLNLRIEGSPTVGSGDNANSALCDNDAKWIFSLLARLDRDLTSDQINTLRVLARECITLLVGSIKSQSSRPEEAAAAEGLSGKGSCWMIVAAVAHGSDSSNPNRSLPCAALLADKMSTFSSAHRLYVKSLYKRSLVNSLNWCIRRDVWRQRAIEIRAEFERNRDVKDPRALAEIFAKTEAELANTAHPDPYIPPMFPGGTKWERNLPPPVGPVFDHEAAHH